jgi:hypothetical protein
MKNSTCLSTLTNHDRNFDGLITISDVGLNFLAYLNAPMGLIYDGIEGSAGYRFLELSAASCSSAPTTVLSAFIWIYLFYLLIGFFKMIAEGKFFESNESVKAREEEKRKDLGY